jgi:VanZ family protein
MARSRRWLIWGVYCALWTTALLLPMEAIEKLPGHKIIAERKLLVAKSLHVIAYAVMTVLSGWLHVSARRRWLLVFLLMGHGTATELIQRDVPGRSGELSDVALDQLGVMLGLLLSWNWWVKKEEGAEAPAN